MFPWKSILGGQLQFEYDRTGDLEEAEKDFSDFF
jgi:hypothetical protein